MAKQENRLKKLLTTNLESKLAKGFPKFKRSIEKEMIKHDLSYRQYRKDRESHRLQALQEISEIREKTKVLLEAQLKEVNDEFDAMNQELQAKDVEMTDEQVQEYKAMADKRHIIANRLHRLVDEDRSQYGVENLIEEDPSDTDTESTKSLDEVEHKEKTIREIIKEHLALGEIPSNFEYSERYRYPYDPKLNTSGKWDLWKQPWFLETFPKHLLEVLKETSQEYLKKESREPFEEGDEEQDLDEEHGPHIEHPVPRTTHFNVDDDLKLSEMD